jgi:hypothetical protein
MGLHPVITKLLGAVIGLAAITTAADARQASLQNGRWIKTDAENGTSYVIVIRGRDWFHPFHGHATIRNGQGSADAEVYYDPSPSGGEVICKYQVNMKEMGDVMILNPASPQTSDYCPSGEFSRQSN